jgi:hypothetical protein
MKDRLREIRFLPSHGPGPGQRPQPIGWRPAVEPEGHLQPAAPFAVIGVPCNNRTDCGCFHTTAGSDVCSELFGPSECAACQRDADCEALGFPAGAACAPVGGDFACAEHCIEEGTGKTCVYLVLQG